MIILKNNSINHSDFVSSGGSSSPRLCCPLRPQQQLTNKPTSSISRDRMEWIDLIRGILMTFVFLYHSEVFYGNKHSWSFLFEPIFLTGFFFISGYLFSSDWNKITIKHKWMQVLRGILIPYFIFMFVFLLPKIAILNYDWKQTLNDIILLRASWFVIAIGVVQLIYSTIFLFSKNVWLIITISVLFTIAGYGFVLMYRVLPDFILNSWILHSSSMSGCLPACINLSFLSTPFFAFGLLYRKYENKYRINASYLVGLMLLSIYLLAVCIDNYTIGSSLCFAACSSNNLLMVIIYFLLAMGALTAIGKKINNIRPLNYIGANTLLFYYFNILMLRVAGVVYNKSIAIFHLETLKDSFGYGNYIVVTSMAIIFTFPIVWFINK